MELCVLIYIFFYFSLDFIFGLIGLYEGFWLVRDDNFIDCMFYYYINMFLFFFIVFVLIEDFVEFIYCWSFEEFMDLERYYML